MDLDILLCTSVLTIGTKALWFIAEHVASMQMLSVQFFEISHVSEGIVSSNTSTRSTFWSDMKSRILRILSGML